MPSLTGSVTETERNGVEEDGDLGLCDEPETPLLCCSISYGTIDIHSTQTDSHQKKKLEKIEKEQRGDEYSSSCYLYFGAVAEL